MVKRYFSGQTAEPSEEFTLDSLLVKATRVLRSDLQAITLEAGKGKLGPASARDLVAYVRLLSELKAGQEEDLSKLTDEQLKALVDGNTKQD